jgi:5'-deoxynucleotidase YfbR-like HD superfamily hydrolase
MTTIDAEAVVDLGHLALAFGRVDRITYHEDGVTPESDTDHTVMLGLVACAFAARHLPDLDLGRVAQYALVHDLLVHDLVEVSGGDTPTLRISAHQKAVKRERERLALERIGREFALRLPWLPDTIHRYERQGDPEARYVKALDKLLPKITHLLNGGVTLRQQAMGRDELAARYAAQGVELLGYAADFPEGHRKSRSGSCSKFVFVDQPTQHIAPLDTQAIGRLASRIQPRIRRPQIQTAVRPLGVVVGDIGPKGPLQMSAAEHQRPVQALGPDGPDPSFSEGVRSRRLDRGEDDLDAVACEHRVEAGGVLCVAVPDQKPEGSPASEVERQVPRLLGDPGGGRVPGRSSQMDPPGAQFDHEEHVKGSEPDGLDGEEVGGQDPVCLVAQELPSGWSRPPRSRPQPVSTQQHADRGRRDPDPELGQLAPDPHAPPPRVLPCHPKDQRPNVTGQWRPPADDVAAEGPLPADELAVPAQQRLRAHDKRRPTRARQNPADRRHEQPVSTAKTRPADLAREHRELMA